MLKKRLSTISSLTLFINAIDDDDRYVVDFINGNLQNLKLWVYSILQIYIHVGCVILV